MVLHGGDTRRFTGLSPTRNPWLAGLCCRAWPPLWHALSTWETLQTRDDSGSGITRSGWFRMHAVRFVPGATAPGRAASGPCGSRAVCVGPKREAHDTGDERALPDLARVRSWRCSRAGAPRTARSCCCRTCCARAACPTTVARRPSLPPRSSTARCARWARPTRNAAWQPRVLLPLHACQDLTHTALPHVAHSVSL